MTIIINGTEYKYEFGSVWGPLYTYEELFGEKIPFAPQRTLCIHLMLYCILVRCNPDMTLSLEDFLTSLNDLKLEKELREYYYKRMDLLTQGVKAEAEDDKKKD